MATATHTPGPWSLVRYKASEDTRYHALLANAADDGRDVTLATIYPVSDDGQPGGESAANARLIAAAPDLLATLRSAEAWVDLQGNVPGCRAAADAMLAAIRKALAGAVE